MGETALYKLHVRPAARYSEDIDLVQTNAEAIGPTIDELRDALDPWLGIPQRKVKDGTVTLLYRFGSEDMPALPMRLKVEINSREHFTVLGHARHKFEVASRWYKGTAQIPSYELDELLGTKLRALYQRKKGRDLFDLALALDEAAVDANRIIATFSHYMKHEGAKITRAIFEQNLAQKITDLRFAADISPLLAHGRVWNIEKAAARVSELIALLPGKPWKKLREK